MAIYQLRGTYSIATLCQIAGVSRSGYYKWVRRRETVTAKDKDDDHISELIQKCYTGLKGIYGHRRVKTWIKTCTGEIVNLKRILRLTRLMGLQAKIRRKRAFYPSVDSAVVSPNILARDFTADKPDRKWVTDITELAVDGKKRYLSSILDLCTREIVAHKISARNDLDLVLETVKAAITSRDSLEGLIVHSDQGFQYTSKPYNKLLSEKRVVVSMSRAGNCLDNSVMENFHGHLKSEYVYNDAPTNMEGFLKGLEDYIHFYNHDRFQARLNDMPPTQFRNIALAYGA